MNKDENQPGIGTRSVHAGEHRNTEGSPHSPIFNSTTFAFPNTRALLDVVEGKTKGPLYTRYGLNPGIMALEEKLASLENAESALVFSSGMAAEAAVFLGSNTKHIVCMGDAYGGTLELLAVNLPELGIRSTFLAGQDFDGLQRALQEGAGLVFFETPTNPTLEIIDIRKVVGLAHEAGALVVIDNTFATPINQNPLGLGADLVIHSATKYLGGHSDVTAGALMGSEETVDSYRIWRKNLGTVPAPETAALLSRSLRTLHVRVAWQNDSALTIAQRFEKHPAIKRVLYPGLPAFAGHELARSQMSGFGGMLTLELAGNGDETSDFVDRLKLFLIAPSLGGAESLVTQPITTTHFGLSPEERQRRGISDTMVRMSIGLENPEDLIRDIEQALEGK